jgi:beta-alanine--pyruvate transaminase
LVGAIDLASRPGAVGARAYEAMDRGFDEGLMMRVTGDTIALSPPLIVTEDQIGEIIDKLTRVIRAVA